MAATKAQVQQLYIAYFGRPADPAGLEYWMSTELEMADIGTLFATSPEAKAAYDLLKFPELAQNEVAREEFLTAVYQNLFGRAPDADGLAYWSERLASGEEVGTILATIITNTGPEDAKIIANKAAVAEYFQQLLLEGGVDLGSEDLNNNGIVDFAETLKDMLAGIGGDAASLEAGKAAAEEMLGKFSETAALVNALQAKQAADQADAAFGETFGANGVELSNGDKVARADLENKAGELQNAIDSMPTAERLAANLVDAKKAADTAQAKLNAKATELKVANEVKALQAAQAAADAATKAAGDAANAVSAADDKFTAGNKTDNGIESDPAGKIFAKQDINGKWVVSTTEAADLPKEEKTALDALVAALNEQVAKDAAAAKAAADLSKADDALDAKLNGNTDLETLFTALGNAKDDVSDAAEAIATLKALEASLVEVKELFAESESLADAVKAADKWFADRDIAVGEVGESTPLVDDLLIAKDGLIGAGEFEAGDKLFIGKQFANAGIIEDTAASLTDGVLQERVGDATKLEVFFEQTATGTKVYLEKDAVAGSSIDNAGDFIVIDLVGVNAEDLVLENGFITLA